MNINKLAHHIEKHKQSFIAVGLITFIWLTIVVTNYISNTYLIGWDNVSIELNFGLNFKRAIFAVWQEFQGVGLVGGHPHAADLPRIIFQFIASLILPLNTIRYSYMFAMLLLGPIGTFFLLKNVVLKSRSSNIAFYVAFAGSMFYLLNLGMVQNFYISLEAFATFYGFLPWLIYILIELLESFNRKRLFLFIIINLLSAPFAFIPQIFLAYTGVVFFIAISKILESKEKRQALKRVLVAILLLFIVHSYWLLPFIYFTANNLGVRYDSQFNTILSEKFFLQNKDYGGIDDVSILRGGYFDTTDYNPENKQVSRLIFQPWIEHLNNPVVLGIGYLTFAMVLIGALSLFIRRDRWWIGFLGIFTLGTFMLMNDNPPLGLLFRFLQENISIFKEAFRFPYNKFSVVALVGFTILFTNGVYLLYRLLNDFVPKYQAVVNLFVTAVITTCLIYFTLPIWKGQLFYNQIQQNIPSEYFELFDYLNQQDPNTRIANFPQYTLYGWNYNNWGYHGSGFLWYGIEQPILDRNFDVWSSINEAYYSEISQALYSKNHTQFKDVLDKYQASWILIDKNIIAPNREDVLFHQELLDVVNEMNELGLIAETKQFDNLYLYRLKRDEQYQNYIFAPETLTEVDGTFKSTSRDLIYEEYGNYAATNESTTFAPFASLTDKSLAIDIIDHSKSPNLVVNNNVEYLSFTKGVNNTLQNSIAIKNGSDLLTNIPFDVYAKSNQTSTTFKFVLYLPTILINGEVMWGGTRSITKTIDYNIVNGVYLYINQKQVIPINMAVTNEYSYISSGQLANDGDHIISVYTLQPKQSKQIAVEKFSDMINCADKEFGETVNLTVLENTLTLKGSNASPCVYAPSDLLIEPDDLLRTEVSYSTPSATIPFLCSAIEGDPSCINNPRSYELETHDNGQNRWVNYTQNTSPNPSNVWVTASLDAYYQSGIQEITYSDFVLSNYAKVAYFNFSQDEIISASALPDSIKYEQSINKISFLFPLSKIHNDLVFDDTRLIMGTNPRNCSYNNKGLGSTTLTNQELIYKSTDGGIACNTYEFPDMYQNQGYVIALESINTNGLPISICLYNYETGHCDIESRLQNSNRNSIFQYLLVPPMVQGAFGYSLNLSSESVGNIESTNILRSLYVKAIPYEQLKSIFIHSNGTVRTNTFPNNVDIISTTHRVPFLYSIEYTSESEKSLIALSQSYGNGWYLVGVPSKHLKLNNWENAWIVPLGQHKVYLIFIPQFFQFIGIILLILTGIYLVKSRKTIL